MSRNHDDFPMETPFVGRLPFLDTSALIAPRPLRSPDLAATAEVVQIEPESDGATTTVVRPESLEASPGGTSSGRLVLNCAHVAYYGVLGRRRQVPAALARPYRWICHLHVTRRDSNGRTTVLGGTGVLVSPRHVLTAAHLVKFAQKDDRGLWVTYEPTSIRVVPGRNGSAAALDAAWATPVFVAPSWNPKAQAPAHDYALVQLDKPVGNTSSPRLNGQKLCYWGDPACGAAVRSVPDRHLLDEAVFTAGYVQDLKDTALYRSQGRLAFSPGGTTLRFSADRWSGHGGSPVWLVLDGQYCLVGLRVTSGIALRLTAGVCDRLRAAMKGESAIGTTTSGPQRESEVEELELSGKREGRCTCRRPRETDSTGAVPADTLFPSDEAAGTIDAVEAPGAFPSPEDHEPPAAAPGPQGHTWVAAGEPEADAATFRNPSVSQSGRAGEVVVLDAEAAGGQQDTVRASVPAVVGRILWPALGFPAVIAPEAGSSGRPASEADATRCITVLLLSNKKQLSQAEAAQGLRCVRWDQRGRRHIASGQPGSFAKEHLTVRNDEAGAGLMRQTPQGSAAVLVSFGGTKDGRHGVTASLATKVLEVYRRQGLGYLHEIRVSEAASATLADGCYHLFWNNQLSSEQAPSDEMALLRGFCRERRQSLGRLWATHATYLMDEYEYEYGTLHRPYCSSASPRRRAEILHPLIVDRGRRRRSLEIGHLTDTHVDVRADVYEANLKQAGVRASYNNWNRNFTRLYADAKKDANAIFITGDLIDYGRGHWGQDATVHLGDDDLYHVDRNWFLFTYLLASGNAYTTPVYTILGNHDWRLNPYPPFAVAGAPGPGLLFNDHPGLNREKEDEASEERKRRIREEQKEVLRTAHGPGHGRAFSYGLKAESTFQLLREKTGQALATLGRMIAQTRTMDTPGYPAETSVESVAWYLLTINPFFDYAFTLPGGHQVLMLDWADKEDVLFPIVSKGKEFPYMVWQAGNAADPGPKARSCLTPLQQRLVTEFTDTPGPSKVIGIHAPPIGPYPDWFDEDLLRGRKVYHRPGDARGPASYATRMPDGTIEKWNGHPIFAVRPDGGAAGMEADYGSLVEKRKWFVKRLADARSGVRLVLSGHIHRNGLYVVHVADRKSGPAIAGQLLVNGVREQQVRGARPPAVSSTAEGRLGPLYVNTTSAGPRGHWHPANGQSYYVDPGYARVELAQDGTIWSVEFRPPRPPRARLASREVALEVDATLAW
jgi:V8-like Glu-specific endopeptidase